MGGCATKPMGFEGTKTLSENNSTDKEITPQSPNETSTAEVKAESTEKVDEAKENKEEPLVDLSPPKEETTTGEETSDKTGAPQTNSKEDGSAKDKTAEGTKKTDEDKIAEKMAEKVEEAADFKEDAGNQNKETEEKKSDTSAEGSTAVSA